MIQVRSRDTVIPSMAGGVAPIKPMISTSPSAAQWKEQSGLRAAMIVDRDPGFHVGAVQGPGGVQAAPTSFKGPLVVREGGVSYGFAGYSAVAHQTDPAGQFGPPYWYGDGNAPVQSDLQEQYAAERVDAHGRVWRVVDVHEDVAFDIVELSKVESMHATHAGGESGWWYPASWKQQGPCTNTFPATGNGVTISTSFLKYDFVWDGQSRDRQRAADVTANQSLVVAIYTSTAFGRDALTFAGTGVLIGERMVLTAAHLFYDVFPNEYGQISGRRKFLAEHVRVCTLGNSAPESACSTVRYVLPKPGFENDALGYADQMNARANPRWLNPVNDMATVELDFPLGASGFMKLSKNSRTKEEIQEAKTHAAGYPLFAPPLQNGLCNFNAGYMRYGVADQHLNPVTLYHEDGKGMVYKVNPKRLRTHFDITGGQSGSPIWMCENTGDNEKECADSSPEVVGLLVGFFNVESPKKEDYSGGPTIDGARGWLNKRV